MYTVRVGRSGDSSIRTSTSRRGDREFDKIDLDGVVVWFDRDLLIDDVRVGWTPLTGFDVTWPWTATAGS